MLVLHPPTPLPPLYPGQTVVLEAGVHQGPWTITTPGVRLVARPGAVLDGGGKGTALTLRAAGIVVEGLEVQNVGPGDDFYEPDAAVTLYQCEGCVVRGLRAKGVTGGIRVEKSNRAVVENCELVGTQAAPGLQTYRSDGVVLRGNRIRGFLDNLYVEYGERVVVEGNRVESGERYGLHLMFTYQAQVRGNHSQGNRVGSALMHGAENWVEGNTFAREVGPLRYGLLLQEEWKATLKGNRFLGSTIGLFSLDSRDTQLLDNRFEGNGTALLFARDADQNTLKATANTFVGNLHDVAVDDPRARVVLRGNAFDRAAPLPIPHLPSSSFALLSARQPDLSLLALSPGVLLWEAAEAKVPGLRLLALADPEARPASPPATPTAPSLLGLALLSLLGGLWLRW
ncbi:MAG: right-handed parallel beta-helix repeat-containing protein [Meiothermus sp.]|uniref:NosD domain-containing protein n=1 Tax=Meiothermus sp. TaxID=1955249 RepID=UPI0025D54B74|nr:NosD domain-containing protein [Meiothermus sp.]MCS7058825.1 right-handed parallel beta-helix repeat-containing protein [Meiothermus sp.]MCS7194075.1 right-handed parallel beta-helix repeat-containing protein [Meiothermus sp.]MCX7740446.1 right-handed parallel beta-helix repeat-containing protein [Meiothermus sp.]MDW8091150.1 NosD domain-containing protein [Meiothermus sp.]MDW8480474.1 NosD domain-containing protein [Meiothermus sp.]